jgi:hypothetical protein
LAKNEVLRDYWLVTPPPRPTGLLLNALVYAFAVACVVPIFDGTRAAFRLRDPVAILPAGIPVVTVAVSPVFNYFFSGTFNVIHSGYVQGSTWITAA